MSRKRRPNSTEPTKLSRRSFIGGALATTLAAAVLPAPGGSVADKARARQAATNAPRWIGHF